MINLDIRMRIACWLLRNQDYAIFAHNGNGEGCGNVDAAYPEELASVIIQGMERRNDVAALILMSAGESLKKNPEARDAFVKEIYKTK